MNREDQKIKPIVKGRLFDSMMVYLWFRLFSIGPVLFLRADLLVLIVLDGSRKEKDTRPSPSAGQGDFFGLLVNGYQFIPVLEGDLDDPVSDLFIRLFVDQQNVPRRNNRHALGHSGVCFFSNDKAEIGRAEFLVDRLQEVIMR